METVVIFLVHDSSFQMVDLVYKLVCNGWWVKGWCMWGGTEERAILLAWCTFLSVPDGNLCSFSLLKELYSKEFCRTANLCFSDSQAFL
jgi:hypothetical protein